MKKKMIALMMVIAMLMTGCGNDIATNTNEKDNAESVTTSNISNTNEVTENSEDVVSNIPEKDMESSIKEGLEGLILEEYKDSFEDRNVDTSGTPVIPFEKFEICGDTFYLTDSINLYIDNGCCIGYTKPNIEIIAIMEYEGWYYTDVSGKSRFVKVSDVEAVGTKKEYPEEIEESISDSVPASETKPTVPPPTSNNPETQKTDSASADNSTEVAQTSDKYTPEEAISVYRGLMEAGGMIWNPSLKGVTSWGTGWIYLDKGMPEWTAETNLESFAIGNHGGNSWTEYYLEVTGSDDECVYITEWHN